jgi:protein-histidine N-methyltransferase
LSYSTVRVESPLGKVIYLPRRELFDVRVQLLQDVSADNDRVIDQIENSDIRAGVYEGGFKTWECSLDLASLLLDRGPRKDIDELTRCDQVLEVGRMFRQSALGLSLTVLQLGCGTALPTLTLFRHALLNGAPGLTFTLADYNEEVLRLVTLPNLLLTWAASTPETGFPTPDTEGTTNGDLELTPDILQRFTSDLASKRISLNFVSGAWSPALAELIPTSAPEMGFLVLAAETIYSPASTNSFVDLLVLLLKRGQMSKAMLGAKRIYFGVGGSVDGLKEACRDNGAVASEIENHGVQGMDGGVGRALVEVQMY